jgi:hypothetical protein
MAVNEEEKDKPDESIPEPKEVDPLQPTQQDINNARLTQNIVKAIQDISVKVDKLGIEVATIKAREGLTKEGFELSDKQWQRIQVLEL